MAINSSTKRDQEKTTRRLLIAALIAFLIAVVLLAIILYLSFRTPPPDTSIIYVVDASERMADLFDEDTDQTLLEAVEVFVRDATARLDDGTVVGLRTFGEGETLVGTNPSSCDDTILQVEPARNAVPEVVDTLDVTAPGQPDAPMVLAAIQALNDFSQLNLDTTLQLVVVTGGLDTCENSLDDVLLQEASRLQIDLEFYFIVLGDSLTPGEREAIRLLVGENEGVLAEAQTAEDLEIVVDALDTDSPEAFATQIAGGPAGGVPTVDLTETVAAAASATPLIPEIPSIEPSETSEPTPTLTSTPVPSPTSTPEPPTETPEVEATTTATLFPTPTLVLTNTPTPTLVNTNTPVPPPPATNTPVPPPASTATFTPLPPTPTLANTATPFVPTPTLTPTPIVIAPSTLNVVDASGFESLGGSTINVQVNRSFPSDGNPVTVDYTLVDGSATAGSDYIAASGTLTWSATETGAKTFAITILDDAFHEAGESLSVQLSNPVNATIADGTGIVTISDNDNNTTVPTGTLLDVYEDAVTVDIIMSLGSEPTANVQVPLSVIPATSACSVSADFIFSPTAYTNVAVSVTITDDGTNIDGEVNEVCTIATTTSVSADPDYNGINSANFTVNVYDNDALYVTGTDTAFEHATVQDAIDNPKIAIDQIFVTAGTKTESGINPGRNVTIQGASAATTILQAAPSPVSAPDRVLNVAAGRVVTLRNITIQNGQITGNGGAINNEGTLNLSGVVVRNSVASAAGGGIANSGALTISGSSITDNVGSGSTGGGINSTAGSVAVTNSTIGNNSSGIATTGGTGTLTNVTIAFNALGSGISGVGLTVEQILSSNNASDCSGAALTSNGFNYINNNTGCTGAVASDVIGGGLANLGGLTTNAAGTLSYTPNGGSPVIDTAGAACASPVDQAGTARPVNGLCDMGAIEQ